MTDINIHDIASIKTVNFDHGDFIVKRLIITNKNGVESTITLFSDNKENVKISNPRYKKV